MPRAKFTPDNVMMREAEDGTIPTKYQTLILKDVLQNSKVMQLGKYEEMDDLEKTFQILAKGPGAYWVDEGKIIQTDKAKYITVKLRAHKLAVILPISREYLNYKASDFFNAMKPKIAEAMYKKFDDAAIMNVDNPYSNSLVQAALAKENVIEGEINYDNILALEDKTLQADFEPNAWISKAQNVTSLRNAARRENGTAEYLYERANNTIDGLPAVNLKSDNMPKGTLFTGDFDYMYYGIPGNLTYKISEDAQLSSIVDENNKPLNLFERDMVALRATMDVALMIVKDDAFAQLKPAGLPEGNEDNKVVEKPTDANTVAEITAWLDEKGIDHTGKTSKEDLVALIPTDE